ncbi:hypothetical protein HK104_009614 [Borealophlyctis nickersoniae]|nr:hypothetical protein HK104_009614 [Borealophlyctis nickersoniae]
MDSLSRPPPRPPTDTQSKPRTATLKEPEALQQELFQARQQINSLVQEKKVLMTKTRALEQEAQRMDRRYQDLLIVNVSDVVIAMGSQKIAVSDADGVYDWFVLLNQTMTSGAQQAQALSRREDKTITDLKTVLKSYQKQIKKVESDLDALKKSTRHTKLIETQIEARTYLQETLRLKRLLEHIEKKVPMMEEESEQLLKYDEVIEELTQRLEDAERQNEHLREIAKRLKDDRDNHTHTVSNLREELSTMHSQFDALDVAHKHKLGHVEELAQRLGRVTEECERVTRECGDVRAEKEGLEKKVDEYWRKICELESHLAASESTHAQTKSALDAVTRAHEETSRMQEETVRSLHESVTARMELEKSLETAQQSQQAHQQTLEQLESRHRAEMDRLTSELAAKTEALANQATISEDVKREWEEKVATLDRLRGEEREEWTRQRESLESQLAQCEAQQQSLAEECQMHREATQRANAVIEELRARLDGTTVGAGAEEVNDGEASGHVSAANSRTASGTDIASVPQPPIDDDGNAIPDTIQRSPVATSPRSGASSRSSRYTAKMNHRISQRGRGPTADRNEVERTGSHIEEDDGDDGGQDVDVDQEAPSPAQSRGRRSRQSSVSIRRSSSVSLQRSVSLTGEPIRISPAPSTPASRPSSRSGSRRRSRRSSSRKSTPSSRRSTPSRSRSVSRRQSTASLPVSISPTQSVTQQSRRTSSISQVSQQQGGEDSRRSRSASVGSFRAPESVRDYASSAGVSDTVGEMGKPPLSGRKTRSSSVQSIRGTVGGEASESRFVSTEFASEAGGGGGSDVGFPEEGAGDALDDVVENVEYQAVEEAVSQDVMEGASEKADIHQENISGEQQERHPDENYDTQNTGELEKAATKIQAAARGLFARKRHQGKKQPHPQSSEVRDIGDDRASGNEDTAEDRGEHVKGATIKVQAMMRGYLARKHHPETKPFRK